MSDTSPAIRGDGAKITALIITVWAVSATLFHLYSSYIGYLEPRIQRTLHLGFMLPLVFILYPTFKDEDGKGQLRWFDWGLAFLAILPAIYSYMEADRINIRLEVIDPVLPMELWMGTIMIVLILVGIKRSVSPVMAGLIVVGISYLFLTEYAPGFFFFRNIPYSEIVESLYLNNNQGIFGSITGISATMLAVFIAFGAFVEGSGTGVLFHNLGLKAAGRYSGGPAKVSVVTSALFGSMSGSSSSNVFTTGTFTIPLMKKLGYRSSFAGGVETAASVGGQIAPPIMGAGAFIMAEVTNTPYSTILSAAILGAVCYFSMVFISVHLEAKKLGLKGMDSSEIPVWSVVIRDLHLFIPIVVLITLIMMRFSPHFAAFYSILTTIAITFLRKHTRLSINKIINIFEMAAKNTAPIALACCGASIFVSVLTKTGVVISLGTLVAGVAGGDLWLAGIMLMVLSLLLGMGVPTTPAYVITSAIGAPALIADFGTPILAAHMFVFYFAVLADATPPVSVASYAAAAIAKSNPLTTGLQAARIAIAGYVVGYNYLFVPELRFEGDLISIIATLAVIIGGLTLFSAGVGGYLFGRLNNIMRIIVASAGLALSLLHQFAVWPRIGLIVVLFALIFMLSKAGKEKQV